MYDIIVLIISQLLLFKDDKIKIDFIEEFFFIL